MIVLVEEINKLCDTELVWEIEVVKQKENPKNEIKKLMLYKTVKRLDDYDSKRDKN